MKARYPLITAPLISWLALATFGASAALGRDTGVTDVAPPAASRIERSTPPTPAADLVVQTGHSGMIHFVGFAGGERVVTVGGDGSARLWDLGTGKEIRTLGRHQEPDRMFAEISPDGKSLFTADIREVIQWDLETGGRIETFTPPIDGEYFSNFVRKQRSADAVIQDMRLQGSRLMVVVGERDQTLVALWNLAAQEEEPRVFSVDHDITSTVADGQVEVTTAIELLSLDVSPDGEMIASAAKDQTLRLWQPDGELIQTLDLERQRETSGRPREPTGPDVRKRQSLGRAWASWARSELDDSALKVRFSPDGRFIASGLLSGEAAIWRLDGKQSVRLVGHDAAVLDVRVSRDGRRVLTASADGTARLWSADSGELARTFAGHRGPVTAVNFDPRERYVLTGGIDGTVTLWDVASGAAVRRFAKQGHRFGFARFHPRANAIVTGSGEPEDATVRPWDLETGRILRTFDGHEGDVRDADLSADGTLLATCGADMTLRLWDLATGREIRRITGHRESFRSKIGQWATGALGYDEMLGEMAQTLTFAPPPPALSSVRFSPDATRLASSSTGEGRVRVWDVATGDELMVSKRQWHEITAVEFDAGGRRIGFGKSVDWNAGTYSGRMGGDSGQVKVWNLDAGRGRKAIQTLGKQLTRKRERRQHRGGISGVRFTTGGNLLSASEDGTAALWDLATGNRVREFLGHTSRITGIDLAADGRTVATSSWDNTARLWDLDTGETIRVLEGHSANVNSVDFSPGGRRLLTASDDGTARLWNVETGEEIVRLIAVGERDYVIATPGNFYSASKHAARGVAFRLDDEIYPFEQFDLTLNRPDLVLERLGSARPELLDAYYRAYLKRLSRAGFSEDDLSTDLHLPEIALVGDEAPVASASKELAFTVRAEDTRYRLERLNVFVNDVPIHGSRGLALGSPRRGASATSQQTAGLERRITLELSAGRNKIQVSAHNEKGVESRRLTFEVAYTGPAPEPELHMAVIGVSQYQDEAITDLRFAAKDARDLAAWFEGHKDRFAAVHVHRLLDADATRDNVLALRQKLAASRVDDQVVVFLAGHGFLDNNLDYYFATTDMVAGDPAARGLPYDAIEGLLDGIPARRKLLMMDTCHAGEVDREETELAAAGGAAADSASGAGLSRGAASVRRKQSGIGLRSSFELMQGLFVNLSRGSGAVAIAAAAGAEYAWEDEEWGNGAFTYSVLSGLTTGDADGNGDGTIRVSELRDYVGNRVSELTGGRQTPTARRENVEFDFPVAEVGSTDSP